MNDTDKEKYVALATSGKEDYARRVAEAKEKGLIIKTGTKKKSQGDFAFPVSRVRNIMLLDKSIKKVSGDATRVVAKATEMFLDAFAGDVHRQFTLPEKKKTMKYADVYRCVREGPERYIFLAEDMPKPSIQAKATAKRTRRATGTAEMLI